MNKACPSCASAVEEWAAFCPRCGTAVPSAPVPDTRPSPVTAGGKCPFCLAPVEDSDTEVVCPACAAVHHSDCWGDAAGCAVMGCAAAAAAPSGAPAAAAPSGPPAAAAPVAFAPAQGFDSAPGWPPPARKQRSKGVIAAVIGIAVAVIIGGVAFASSMNESHTVTGDMSVVDVSDYMYLDDGDSCTGRGGYSDIRSGTQVTLENGSGESLAIGSLDSGVYDSSEYACVFSFTLTDVPKEDFYRFEISHRGTLSYSYDDMVESGWEIHSSLGS